MIDFTWLTSKSEHKANTSNLPQALENVDAQVAIGFGFSFASDWLQRSRDFFKLIRKQKPQQLANHFRHSIENCSITHLQCFQREQWNESSRRNAFNQIVTTVPIEKTKTKVNQAI